MDPMNAMDAADTMGVVDVMDEIGAMDATNGTTADGAQTTLQTAKPTVGAAASHQRTRIMSIRNRSRMRTDRRLVTAAVSHPGTEQRMIVLLAWKG